MKLTNYIKMFLMDFSFTKDTRKKILNAFKTNVLKKTIDCNNYLVVKKSSKAVRVYEKNLQADINYVREIPLETPRNEYLTMLESLSYAAHKFLDNSSKAEYSRQFNSFNYSNRSIGYSLERLVERTANTENSIYDEEGYLCEVVANQLLTKKQIYTEKELINKVKIYSYENGIDENLQKDVNGKIILSEKAYQKYIIDLESIPMSVKEKIKSSTSRTYQTITNLLKCNAECFKYFVTLTFAKKENALKYEKLNLKAEGDVKFNFVDDSTDYESCVKSLVKFFGVLKNALKRKEIDFYYLGVPEYHKDGRIHYHFLMSDFPDDFLYKIPAWLDFDNVTGRLKNDKGIKYWKYGKSTVEPILSTSRVSSYISDYINKNIYNLSETEYFDRLNKKRYYCSNNLTKPIVTYGDDKKVAEKIYSTYEKTSFNSYLACETKTTILQIKELT